MASCVRVVCKLHNCLIRYHHERAERPPDWTPPKQRHVATKYLERADSKVQDSNAASLADLENFIRCYDLATPVLDPSKRAPPSIRVSVYDPVPKQCYAPMPPPPALPFL